MVERRIKLGRLQPASRHLAHHERYPGTVPLRRRAGTARQQGQGHELHERWVSTARPTVGEVIRRLTPQPTGIGDLDTVFEDIDRDRFPVKALVVTAMKQSVRDGLAQNRFRKLQLIDAPHTVHK